MDSERLIITEEAAELINKTKKEGHKVAVVGTTTMKALESSVYDSGMVKTTEMNGKEDMWTNKFIYPPYRFKVANAMVTNFHAPPSRLKG